ncbi:MAG: type 1 glutamine amidotransferase [Desulfobulbaceae bacterium]|jgi:protease I|nr:type 1 glutamine amidotransferase [Desulfobulbaceae bacterium]MDH3777135.1 type 1 glutamine amidotransferase [Desulfobulbaceae bacterium]MDH3865490.1 type 1 glutamine amidotransferase [Desulfobulbaceae bacterium]
MNLAGKKVFILVETIYNDLEFWYPYYRLKEAGAEVIVVGPMGGMVYNGKAGLPVKADAGMADVTAADCDGLIIPGGYAPDHMRRHPQMVQLVRDCVESGKIVAAICHAGWMLASADVLHGRTVTSFFAIKDDLVHAGATFVDQEVVVDGNIITSRTPDDLPPFMRAIISALA